MSETPKALPCPFCGETPDIVTELDGENYRSFVGSCDDGKRTMHMTLEDWNTRAPHPAEEECRRLRHFVGIVLRFESQHIGTQLLHDEARRCGIAVEKLR